MKPILFNTAMVRAILEGRKTQTRRVCKVTADNGEAVEREKCVLATSSVTSRGLRIDFYDKDSHYVGASNSPYLPGDILYVRETAYKDAGRYLYKANYSDNEKFYMNGHEIKIRWTPSIHMKKEAARIFLRVTGVSVEPLQTLLVPDAYMEGIPYQGEGTVREIERRFIDLWDGTVTDDKYKWAANPWVYVISFERIT